MPETVDFLGQLSAAPTLSEAYARVLDLAVNFTRAHGASLHTSGQPVRLQASEGSGFALGADENTMAKALHTAIPLYQEHYALLPFAVAKQPYLLQLVGVAPHKARDLWQIMPIISTLLEGIDARSTQNPQEALMIAELARNLESTLELETVLSTIAEVAVKKLGLERAFLGLYEAIEEHSAETGAVYSYGFGEMLLNDTIRITPETFQRLVRQQEAIVYTAQNDQSDPVYQRLNHDLGMVSCIIIPLQDKGVLYIDTQDPLHPIGSSDVGLALAFAQHAATVIESARQFADEKHKHATSEALRSVAFTLSSTLNLGEILQMILEKAVDIFKASASAVFELDSQKEFLRIRTALNLENDFLLNVRSRLGHGVVGVAVAQNTPYVLPNAHEHYQNHPEAWEGYNRMLQEQGAYPFKGIIGLPLASRGQVFGGLALYFNHAIAFNPEDISLLEVFAGQAALAIENARLYEEQVQRERETALLLRFARASSHNDWNTACADMAALLGADATAIVLLDGEYQPERMYTYNLEQLVLPIHDLLEFLERSITLSLKGLYDDKYAMCAPIYANERLLGYVYAASERPEPDFSRSETELLSAVADQLSLVFSGELLFSALKRQEEQYRILAEAAEDLILTTDPSGVITYANPATFKVLGYSPPELLGKSYQRFLPPTSAQDIKNLWNAANTVAYQTSVYSKTTDTVYIELKLNPILREERLVGFLVVARDLSEQYRSAEEIKQRGQALALSQERQMELRTYLNLFTQAGEEERRRIARELHDDTAQVLVAITRRVDRLSRELQHSPLQKQAEDIRSTLEEAIGSVRRFARNLRPSILDDLGLVPALEWLVHQARTPTRLELQGCERRLAPETELTIFRVVQEALTNVDKHAKASSAAVRVQYSEQAVHIWVIDDGIGFAAPNLLELAHQGHLGLLGLKERVQLSGGELQVHSQKEHGTELHFFFKSIAHSS